MPSAKKMQQVTERPPAAEQKIRLTVWEDSSYHFELILPAAAVRDLLDPDVPDAFIEIPIPLDVHNVKVRYLHTSRIARIDVHDDLPPVVPRPQQGG